MLLVIGCNSQSFEEGEATAVLMGELRERTSMGSLCLEWYGKKDFNEKYIGNGVWIVSATSKVPGGSIGTGRWKVYEKTESVLTLHADRKGC